MMVGTFNSTKWESMVKGGGISEINSEPHHAFLLVVLIDDR